MLTSLQNRNRTQNSINEHNEIFQRMFCHFSLPVIATFVLVLQFLYFCTARAKFAFSLGQWTARKIEKIVLINKFH